MLRRFSTIVRNTNDVKLFGTLIKSKYPDMPTVLAFPDLLENPTNLLPLFNKTFFENRNVWFLSYRNSWRSDRHTSMEAEELANDVIRFMDQNRITMASVLGHGFGARVATITGVLKFHRITSVVALDYSPQDYTRHACWLELKNAVELASTLNLEKLTKSEAQSVILRYVENRRLAVNLINCIEGEAKGELKWRAGIKELAINMNSKDERSNIGKFPLIGQFPGRSLFLYGERSNWVHQGSNTIPIYNVFPGLVREYGEFIDHLDTDNHWLHETEHAKSIGIKIAQFYKWFDGVHPLLRDRSEIGKLAIPVRSRETLTAEEKESLLEVGNPTIPKLVPVHRHHNWAYSEDARKVQIP